MWWLDFPSLILIVAAGIQVGLQAFFGWDALGSLLGDYALIVFKLMGISAIWQIFRQRFI
jgi:uncharacterized membrane protein YuzA (DUF378 family)